MLALAFAVEGLLNDQPRVPQPPARPRAAVPLAPEPPPRSVQLRLRETDEAMTAGPRRLAGGLFFSHTRYSYASVFIATTSRSLLAQIQTIQDVKVRA